MVAAITALGLRKARLPTTIDKPERIALGIIRVPLLGDLLLGSLYGWPGVGPRGANLQLLGAIPPIERAVGLPSLIGGDFNMSRIQVEKTGLLKRAGLEALVPSDSTCITGSWRGASVIDFFLASGGLH